VSIVEVIDLHKYYGKIPAVAGLSLAYCLPLTYGVDLLKRALTVEGMMNIWLNAMVLCGFAGLLFYICHKIIRRKWIL